MKSWLHFDLKIALGLWVVKKTKTFVLTIANAERSSPFGVAENKGKL